jgi:hypothetical protein
LPALEDEGRVDTTIPPASAKTSSKSGKAGKAGSPRVYEMVQPE